MAAVPCWSPPRPYPASRPPRNRPGSPTASTTPASTPASTSAPNSPSSRSAPPASWTCSARWLDGEELTELPGSPQLALLHTLRRAAEGDWSGYDTLVVDLPPLAEALALLALPEQLRRYLRRLLPAERQAARALRPVLAQLAGVPMPAQWLYEAAARKDAELAAVQALIEDGATTLRLVAEPGPAAEDALRAARTGLALHGLGADLLVASRVLPRHSSDPWFAALAAQQEKCLDHWHQDAAPDLPVHEAAHLGRDPEGPDDLAALEIPAPDDRTPGRAG